MDIIKYISKLERTLRRYSCANVALLICSLAGLVTIKRQNLKIRALQAKIEEGESA